MDLILSTHSRSGPVLVGNVNNFYHFKLRIRNHGMDTESRTCFVVSAEHCNTTWSVTSVAAAAANLNVMFLL